MSVSKTLGKTAGDLVAESLRAGRIIAAEQPIANVDYQNGLDAMNNTLKFWQARGVHLWSFERAALPLNEGQKSYILGSSGANCGFNDTFGSTKIDSDASQGDTSLTVKDTSDMSANDQIGVELDDGTRQWETISSVTNSTTVVISSGLNDDSASGNTVYFYTSQIDKPLRLDNVTYASDADSSEIPVERWARQEYMEQTSKDSKGTVTAWYYQPRDGDGVLYVWQTASDVRNILYFDMRKPIDVYDNTSDDLNVPSEYYMALKWATAAELGPEYGVPVQRQQVLEEKAFRYLDLALDNDAEDSPMFLAPDMEPY